jgi:hypothetical protein
MLVQGASIPDRGRSQQIDFYSKHTPNPISIYLRPLNLAPSSGLNMSLVGVDSLDPCLQKE